MSDTDSIAPKRVIIRQGTPLTTAVAAVKMFTRDYVEKGHKVGQHHHRNYVGEDGLNIKVWHTAATIIALAVEEEEAPEAEAEAEAA